MKKTFIIGMLGLTLLAGCGSEEKEDYSNVPESQNVTGETTEKVEKEPPVKRNESVLENHGAYVQKFDEDLLSVTKFFQKDTGKLVYVMQSTHAADAVMIDADENQAISKNFLEVIEVVNIEDPAVTTYMCRDKDNGNIVAVSSSSEGYGGSIDVQKQKQ